MSPNRPMTIRPATAKDAPAISALIRALTREFIAHELTEAAAAFLLDSMDEPSIRFYLLSGYRYHVAEAEGRIVGVIAIKENRHLYHFFVSKGFQGRGIGRALWEVAKKESLAAGNPGTFTVNSSLGAVAVYEKLGFVKQSEAVSKDGVFYLPMKFRQEGRNK